LKNIDPKNETEYRFIAEAILSPVEDLNRCIQFGGKDRDMAT